VNAHRKILQEASSYLLGVQSFRQFIYLVMWCEVLRSEWQIL